jgi:hypothetical protein
MSELLRAEATIRDYNQLIELYEGLGAMTRIAFDMSGKVALVTGGGYGMGRLERAPVVGAPSTSIQAPLTSRRRDRVRDR